jgi:centromere protein I
MFAGLSFNVNYFTTIQKLVEHVDRISVMGFLAENDHPLLQHAALDFFELVALIPLQHDIPEIIIPAANFVHRSFFSSHAMAVSRICGIVCQYKMAFEENDKKSDDWMSRHSSEYLGHFNTYMKDICNSLWRNMGFKITPATPEDIIAFSLTK